MPPLTKWSSLIAGFKAFCLVLGLVLAGIGVAIAERMSDFDGVVIYTIVLGFIQIGFALHSIRVGLEPTKHKIGPMCSDVVLFGLYFIGFVWFSAGPVCRGGCTDGLRWIQGSSLVEVVVWGSMVPADYYNEKYMRVAQEKTEVDVVKGDSTAV
ncbi:hypothetical protein DICA0_E40140 [Diutina catenulata]